MGRGGIIEIKTDMSAEKATCASLVFWTLNDLAEGINTSVDGRNMEDFLRKVRRFTGFWAKAHDSILDLVHEGQNAELLPRFEKTTGEEKFNASRFSPFERSIGEIFAQTAPVIKQMDQLAQEGIYAPDSFAVLLSELSATTAGLKVSSSSGNAISTLSLAGQAFLRHATDNFQRDWEKTWKPKLKSTYYKSIPALFPEDAWNAQKALPLDKRWLLADEGCGLYYIFIGMQERMRFMSLESRVDRVDSTAHYAKVTNGAVGQLMGECARVQRESMNEEWPEFCRQTRSDLYRINQVLENAFGAEKPDGRRQLLLPPSMDEVQSAQSLPITDSPNKAAHYKLLQEHLDHHFRALAAKEWDNSKRREAAWPLLHFAYVAVMGTGALDGQHFAKTFVHPDEVQKYKNTLMQAQPNQDDRPRGMVWVSEAPASRTPVRDRINAAREK